MAVDRHDATTCPTCAPVLATEAWARGAARALLDQDVLPLSSDGRDVRPGRDGYELPGSRA